MKEEYKDAKKMIEAALALDEKDIVANFCNAYLALKQKARGNLLHTEARK